MASSQIRVLQQSIRDSRQWRMAWHGRSFPPASAASGRVKDQTAPVILALLTALPTAESACCALCCYPRRMITQISDGAVELNRLVCHGKMLRGSISRRPRWARAIPLGCLITHTSRCDASLHTTRNRRMPTGVRPYLHTAERSFWARMTLNPMITGMPLLSLDWRRSSWSQPSDQVTISINDPE